MITPSATGVIPIYELPEHRRYSFIPLSFPLLLYPWHSRLPLYGQEASFLFFPDNRRSSVFVCKDTVDERSSSTAIAT